MSFATRTVFIALLTKEYLGVNGLFSNILSILSLAELGAGGAFVSLLYQPLAEHDTKRLASVMTAYKKVYFFIGCITGFVGVCFIPFLGFFTNYSTLPDLPLIYLLFLANSVVTYFCADRKDLITADQKGYLITTYSQVSVIVQYALQILLLLLTHNYILYLSVQITCSVGLSFYVVIKARHLYPFLKEPAAPLSAEDRTTIRKKITGGACVHAGYVVASGTDSLVITHFLGLGVLGVYSNYLLIINMISKLTNMVLSAVRPSASNLVVSTSPQNSYAFFRKLNFMTVLMMGFCATCLITLLNPFITVWIDTDFLLDTGLVILAVLIYVTGCYGLKYPLIIYRDAMGLYTRDQIVSLAEGFINLAISLTLARPFGLAGIFLGTVLSSICTFVSSSYLVYRYIFQRPPWEYWRTMLGYGLIVTGVGCAVYRISYLIPHSSWPTFFLMAAVCAILTLACYVLIFYRTEEFQYFWNLLRQGLHKRTGRT